MDGLVLEVDAGWHETCGLGALAIARSNRRPTAPATRATLNSALRPRSAATRVGQRRVVGDGGEAMAPQ